MGPRFCDRGEHAGNLETHAITSQLQWGRGFVTAERRWIEHRYSSHHAMLQWGRGFVTAESAFANTFPITNIFGLQWGRGFVTAERAACCRGVPPTLACFNGAAVL